MIRTRLSIAFALISLIALAQCLFAWWAAASAARHAERSVVAAGFLAEYESLAGNKQRLKVWFAEAMLVGPPPLEVREALFGRMEQSMRELRALAARDAAIRGGPSPETGFIDLLELNVRTFEAAIRRPPAQPADATPAQQWRQVIRAFDELAGRDVRILIRAAIERQEAASAEEAQRLAAALQRSRSANLLLALGVLLSGGFAVLYFVRQLRAPFAELTRLATRFAAGDLQARSHLSGHDEFGRIGALLDSMAARLAEAQARDARVQESLDALVAVRTRAVTHAHETMLRVEARRRQFFAEVSHELRTPVTVIRGEADIALRGPAGSEGELRASLRRIAEAAGDLGSRVQDLLDAARKGSLDYAFSQRELDLRGVVAGATAQMQAVAAYRGLRLELAAEMPPDMRVLGDPERLQQALVIVLDNALRYSPEGGAVSIRLSREVDWLRIVVDDQGPGMSAAEIERAFEPHFRGAAGRDLGQDGAGLGLSIGYRILAAHRGSIELGPRPRDGAQDAGAGLRVALLLPAANDSESGTA